MIDYAAVNRYIGEEWNYDTNNCWHLVCRASKDLFGVDIEPVDMDGAWSPEGAEAIIAREAVWPRWGHVDNIELRSGDVVVMGGAHIGLHIENGMILHCCKSRGTCYDHLELLARIYKTLEFYRYRSCHG